MHERLMLVGAGSAVCTKGLVSDLLRQEWEGELRLVDTDPKALAVAERLAAKMLAAGKSRVKLSLSGAKRRQEAYMLCLGVWFCAAASLWAADVKETNMPAILKDVRKVVFYGDSLTDGSSYPDYVVNTLNRLYPDARLELVNAAGCGETAANLRARLAADVLVHKPGLVTICIGTNDCVLNRTTGDYRADLEALVAALKETGSRVLLVRPSPFGDAAREARFQDFLAAIDSVGKAHALPVADAHGLFLAWLKEGKEPLGGDGIHHGKDGFECMARAVLAALGLKEAPLDMTVKPYPGSLLAWETSDPVPAGTPLDPAAAKGWRPYDAAALAARQPWWNSPFPQRGAWMPFDDNNPKAFAYGRTWFDAPQAGDYELQTGGPGATLWVNGVKVWEPRRRTGFHPNADRVVVQMHKGRNEIIGTSNFMLFVGVKARDAL